jgi:tetratricopeptide (TPR) repeat protein
MFEKLYQLKTQLGLIALISLILNINTFTNQYALDDEIIILQNLNVQAGVDGINKILTTDAFQGYLDMAGAQSPVSGGRFRPLSIITFAIEQSLFGETYGLEYREAQKRLANIESSGGTQKEIGEQINALEKVKNKITKAALDLAPLRHIVQFLLFTISMLVLLLFLRKHIFTTKPILAFITVLLFVTHPVHTEVIANIKSRDEILSFLFIILTLHYCFSYAKEKTKRNLWLATISFILALLSKEYAMIVPFIVVIGYLSILKMNTKDIFNSAIIRLIVIASIFILIRFTVFNNLHTTSTTIDVLNNPYLYATPIQSFASKVSLLWEYLRVLLFPIHLSSDYSYSHFTYIGLANWKFLASLILYIGLAVSFFYALKKRMSIAFPLAIFIGFLILVNNLVFNIGATMGERLVYHSSLGLCIILVMFSEKIYDKIALEIIQKKILFAILLLPVLLLFSFKTINRNSDWKSNYTLFSADVKTVPNSTLANSNIGTEIYNKAYTSYSELKNPSVLDTENYKKELKSAIVYFDKAIQIHPKYVVAHLNRGLCYFHLGNKEKAGENWIQAAKLFNGPHPFLKQNSYVFLNEGMTYGSKKEFKNAVKPLVIASKMNSYDASIWNNLGGSYFMTGQFKLAADAFGSALSIDPTLSDAQNGKRVAQAIANLEEKISSNTTDIASRNELQKAYASCGVSKEFLKIKY